MTTAIGTDRCDLLNDERANGPDRADLLNDDRPDPRYRYAVDDADIIASTTALPLHASLGWVSILSPNERMSRPARHLRADARNLADTRRDRRRAREATALTHPAQPHPAQPHPAYPDPAQPDLTPTWSEVKSMRTVTSGRGRGIAAALLLHVLDDAERRGRSA